MRLVIATALCALLAGCAPYGSYPPVEETASVTRLTFEPAPTIVTTSIEWAREKETGDVASSPIRFTLPVGSSAEAYEQIQDRIEGSTRGNPGEPAINVRSVRVRGFDATVDITVPRDGQDPMLYTLTLKSKPFERWRVVAERRWRFSEGDMVDVQYEGSSDTDDDIADASRE